MHLTLVLIRFAFAFDRAEKVSEVLVLVAHIPTFIGEFLIRKIDARKLLLKLLCIQFPCRFDCRGREDHRVGGKTKWGDDEEEREEGSGAFHGA